MNSYTGNKTKCYAHELEKNLLQLTTRGVTGSGDRGGGKGNGEEVDLGRELLAQVLKQLSQKGRESTEW